MKLQPWQRYTPRPPCFIGLRSRASLSITVVSGGRYAHAYGICAPFYCISLKNITGRVGYNAARGLISRDIASICTSIYLSRNLKNDPCYKEGESTFRKIKFTTCVQNQFTCNDGECIDIEKRYIYSFLKVKNVELIEIAFKLF